MQRPKLKRKKASKYEDYEAIWESVKDLSPYQLSNISFGFKLKTGFRLSEEIQYFDVAEELPEEYRVVASKMLPGESRSLSISTRLTHLASMKILEEKGFVAVVASNNYSPNPSDGKFFYAFEGDLSEAVETIHSKENTIVPCIGWFESPGQTIVVFESKRIFFLGSE